MPATYEGRPFVLVRRTAVFHESRTRRLPVLSDGDLLARFDRRPDCVPVEKLAPKKGRVTDPALMNGRTEMALVRAVKEAARMIDHGDTGMKEAA